jgi:hypothetical protein
MHVPRGDLVLDSVWLSRVLTSSPTWPYGVVEIVRTTRIGLEHGLSGRIHRVSAETERGDSISLVVKQESAGAVERELLVRHELGERLRGLVPDCHCGMSDPATNRGVLVLEDVAPADQGDVLVGCPHERAEAVVRLLACVHGASWRSDSNAIPSRLPRWGARPLEQELWRSRLARAAERFPQVLARSITERLEPLPAQVARSLVRLWAGPVSWIHADAHLDNVLWRRDGSAVLLDWSNAAVGPPVLDLARFLGEGIDPESRSALITAYHQELSRGDDVRELLGPAQLWLLQSAVAWAGSEDPLPTGRAAAVCEAWLRQLCAWHPA